MTRVFNNDETYDLEGKSYYDMLERVRRDTLEAWTYHAIDGWSVEEHRHWVETGEEPPREF